MGCLVSVTLHFGFNNITYSTYMWEIFFCNQMFQDQILENTAEGNFLAFSVNLA